MDEFEVDFEAIAKRMIAREKAEAVKREQEEKEAAKKAESPPAEKKNEPEPIEATPIDARIKLPEPNEADQALVAVPVVKHWLFAPDGTRLRYREFDVTTLHRRKQLVQKVCIGDRWAEKGDGYGILTARHQRAIFALQRIWQEQGGRLAGIGGTSHGVLCASSWQLEQEIFQHHGGRTKRLVRQMIQGLSSIPIAIENYVNSDGEVEDIDLTGLIRGAEFCSSRRGEKGQMGFPWVEIYLSSVLTRAFEESAVKPLNMRVLSDLGGSPAALLYPKFDYLLSHHEEAELRLGNVVERLGMTGNKQMHQIKYRRRKLAPYVEALNGLPLSQGSYVLDAKLEPTADKLDFKIHACRQKK